MEEGFNLLVPWQRAILLTLASFSVLAEKVIRVNVIQACPVYFATISSFSQDRFLTILGHSVCVTAGRRGRRLNGKRKKALDPEIFACLWRTVTWL